MQQGNREQGSADRRIRAEDRSPDEMEHEVAQRAARAEPGEEPRSGKPNAPAKELTSGKREDRENPAMGLQQSGERQSHELPGEGTRVGDGEVKTRANSQNGAAIRDFEDRPSR